jgi:hypothetical protein
MRKTLDEIVQDSKNKTWHEIELNDDLIKNLRDFMENYYRFRINGKNCRTKKKEKVEKNIRRIINEINDSDLKKGIKNLLKLDVTEYSMECLVNPYFLKFGQYFSTTLKMPSSTMPNAEDKIVSISVKDLLKVSRFKTEIDNETLDYRHYLVGRSLIPDFKNFKSGGGDSMAFAFRSFDGKDIVVESDLAIKNYALKIYNSFQSVAKSKKRFYELSLKEKVSYSLVTRYTKSSDDLDILLNLHGIVSGNIRTHEESHLLSYDRKLPPYSREKHSILRQMYTAGLPLIGLDYCISIGLSEADDPPTHHWRASQEILSNYVAIIRHFKPLLPGSFDLINVYGSTLEEQTEDFYRLTDKELHFLSGEVLRGALKLPDWAK